MTHTDGANNIISSQQHTFGLRKRLAYDAAAGVKGYGNVKYIYVAHFITHQHKNGKLSITSVLIHKHGY